MRLIIVGNSPDLLKKTNGSIIDQYDLIVRMNHFEIEGFEKHVGTRTDIYAVAWATPKKKAFNEFEYVIHYTGPNNLIGYIPSENEKILMPDDYKAMDQELLFTHYDSQPSLGVSMIYYFTTYYPEAQIWITGFDYFGLKNNEYTFGHYYEENRYPRLRAYMHHEPDKEMQYVQKLIDNKIIQEL